MIVKHYDFCALSYATIIDQVGSINGWYIYNDLECCTYLKDQRRQLQNEKHHKLMPAFCDLFMSMGCVLGHCRGRNGGMHIVTSKKNIITIDKDIKCSSVIACPFKQYSRVEVESYGSSCSPMIQMYDLNDPKKKPMDNC